MTCILHRPSFAHTGEIDAETWAGRQTLAPAGLQVLVQAARQGESADRAERDRERQRRLTEERAALERAIAATLSGVEWLGEFRCADADSLTEQTRSWVVYFDLRRVGYQPVALRMGRGSGGWHVAVHDWIVVVAAGELRFRNLGEALLAASHLPTVEK